MAELIEEKIFEGVVIPLNWDSEGRPFEIAMSTNNEEILPLILSKPSYILHSSLQKMVQIHGELVIVKGVVKLRVRTFKLIHNYTNESL